MLIYTFQFILNPGSTSVSCSKIRYSNSRPNLSECPCPWIFTKLMDVIAAHLRQHAISLLPYLDSWLIRNLIRNRLISHNILPSNSSKFRVHPKIKKVRFDTSSAVQLHRVGISDTRQYSQGTSRSYLYPTSDYQTISNSDSSFWPNFHKENLPILFCPP